MCPWAAKRLKEFNGDISQFRVVKQRPSSLHQVAVSKTEPGDENNLSKQEPNIQVLEVDIRGNRSLTLQHIETDRIPLNEDDATEVLKHLHYLWHFDVRLDSIWEKKITNCYFCEGDSVR